jgi:hypothetical protein
MLLLGDYPVTDLEFSEKNFRWIAFCDFDPRASESLWPKAFVAGGITLAEGLHGCEMTAVTLPNFTVVCALKQKTYGKLQPV